MTLEAGTRLGPYEILAPIGAGGMGEVYRARDMKLDRDVAVKVLPERLAADPDALARFEREAKAVAALSHPNILSIFDFGAQDGVVYAATELLEGETLRGKLDAGPVSQKQAVDYAVQIAKGLSAAHERGVVHRDLKPDNLFVSRDGHVKILDFGLALRRSLDATGREQTAAGQQPLAENDETAVATLGGPLTEPGTVMGTVGYMSPEQVRGLPVDHRSDIFSFGAILYELLTGARAFRRDTPSDTMAAILRDEPPEPALSGRNVSPALDNVVRHCLEKDRANRFQSATDIAFALTEASSQGFTRSGIPAMAEPRGGSRKLLVLGAAALVLAAAGIFFWRASRRSGETDLASGSVKRIAVLPFENQGPSDEDYFADGIADEVRGKLTALAGLQVIARASSTPYRKTAKAPKQIAQELNAPYLLTGTVRWEKIGDASRVYVTPELVDVTHADAPVSKWQQRFDAPLTDVFQVQSDIAAKVAQALDRTLGAGEQKRLAERPTGNLAAYDAFLKGRDALGEGRTTDPASLRKGLGFFEQAVALDPSFVEAWAALSHAATSLYANGVPTPELSRRAKEAAEKAIALAPKRPDGYSALGGYERLVRNDLEAAAEQYEKGRRLAPGDTSFLFATAQVEQGLGRWDASLQHLRDAARANPRSVPTWRVLGTTLMRMRRYPEAREALDRALALSPTNIDALEYMAMTYVAEGDLRGAREVVKTAPKEVDPTQLVAAFASYYNLGWVLDDPQRDLLLRLTPSAFDDDRGHWAWCLAEAYHLRGDAPNVRRYAEQAVNTMKEQVAAAPEDGGRHGDLGVALSLLGRKEEAIREGERCVALEGLAKDKLFGSWNERQLALIYARVGEPEKALDRLEPILRLPSFLSPGWLKIDPAFDPLRGNPRFEKLVAAK